MEYRIQVNTYGDRTEDIWTGNAKIYPDQESAVTAVKDLFQRWTAVKHYRVIDSTDTVVFRSNT